MNAALAKDTLRWISELGVREICVCPGSRNAPWIQLLSETSAFKSFYFYEERSAAFFALGRIRASGLPVAVMTTSGTAAGELLPATMEAYYSGLPLILLTADRPKRFRGTGAPQSAEQVGIFGQYAECIDLDASEAAPKTSPQFRRPLHLNVCFEEPTKKETAAVVESPTGNPSFIGSSNSPFVIVGALSPEERAPVREFLLRLGAPTYFEALSGLREDSELERIRVHVADRIFDRAHTHGYPIDGVLRIGGIPTHRIWRDLEDRFPKIPVLCVSRLSFAGLARPAEVLSGPIPAHLKNLSSTSAASELQNQAQGLFEADRIAKRKLLSLLETETRSEAGLIHSLSKTIPERARVFVGNSLPIREWDLAASWQAREIEVFATRGVNGIDGQISTFLGLCEETRSNWGIFGDLTTLYDLSGPWILPQLAQMRANIVVINNGGGKIFERMYNQREFQNPHGVTFEGMASLWDLDYIRAVEIDPTWAQTELKKSRLIEIMPDESATRRFWEQYSS